MNSGLVGIVFSLIATFIFVHPYVFYNARHLAAKLGTNLAVFDLTGLLH